LVLEVEVMVDNLGILHSLLLEVEQVQLIQMAVQELKVQQGLVAHT
jgi:hypothetical protein